MNKEIISIRKIYFVRHSIRDFTYQQDATARLTQEGIRLSHQLKTFFLDKNITYIYSSPYTRAIQTIQPTAHLLQLPIIQK
jgi:Fructose-2,6-bisphosphatase